MIKNTAVKVVHRLPALDDRETVGVTMNLTEAQSRYLVTLKPGTGAVFTDGMDFPLLVQMPDATAVESAAPAVIEAPTVVGRRGATCGADCAAAPCTLREMRAAERLPETEPWLLAWADLAVLAHLTGWVMPVPRLPRIEALRRLPDRLRDCAISQAVDAAVAARSTAIATTHSPARLAVHVADAVRARLAGRQPCGDEEPRWLAAPYRWSLIHDGLKHLCREDPSAGRHPRSDEWERTYGRHIPGETADQQRQAVRVWFEADLRDRVTCEVVAWGVHVPSPIESAAGSRRTAPDWPQRLTEALDAFLDYAWPHRYLKPTNGSPDAQRSPEPRSATIGCTAGSRDPGGDRRHPPGRRGGGRPLRRG